DQSRVRASPSRRSSLICRRVAPPRVPIPIPGNDPQSPDRALSASPPAGVAIAIALLSAVLMTVCFIRDSRIMALLAQKIEGSRATPIPYLRRHAHPCDPGPGEPGRGGGRCRRGAEALPDRGCPVPAPHAGVPKGQEALDRGQRGAGPEPTALVAGADGVGRD